MPDDEREKMLSEAIMAFRNAVYTLIDPAPDLLASLSMVEDWPGLAAELPLVDFSPFAILPDDPPDDQTLQVDETGYTPGSVRLPASTSPVQRGNSPPVRPGTDLSWQQPVFSLQPQDARGNKSIASPGTPGPSQPSPSESGSGQKSPLASRGYEGQASFATGTESQETSYSVKMPMAGERSTRARALVQTVALLNDLADSILESKLPGPTDATRLLSETNQSRQPISFQGVASRLTRAARELPGDSVISMVGSLTEELLSVYSSSTTNRSEFGGVLYDRSATPAKMPGYTENQVPNRTDIGVELTDPIRPDLKRSQSDERGTTGVAAGQQIDAGTLAALVNDILVEQAERHGVDLS